MKAVHSRRPVAAPLGGLLIATAAGLAGCSDAGEDPEAGTAVEVPEIRGPGDITDPYTGALDAAFRDDLDVYTNVEVTVLARVEDILSTRTFTVTSPVGPEIDPVLVVVAESAADSQPVAGEEWVIAATPLESFDAGVVADELGITLLEEQYEEWDDEVFLVATALQEAE